MKRALILVDLQNDFLPGGALAVHEGDAVVPIVNQLLARFEVVAATQDWHPREHVSFAANHPGRQPGETVLLYNQPQTLWPVHCVQGTKGAELSAQLDRQHIDRIFYKGADPLIDSYSGFFDNGHVRSTGLAEWLRDQQVTEVYIAGLATDYCVRYTALDARKEGFSTWLIADACRGVNLHPGDVDRAIDEMRRAGVRIVTSRDVLCSN